MPVKPRNKRKIQSRKSEEIIFKEPSLFRKIVSFITAYSMLLLNISPAFATNITGVAGNNGVMILTQQRFPATQGSGNTRILHSITGM